MSETGDRKFGWVASLAMASMAAVVIPSLAALAVTQIAVAAAIF